MVFGLFTALVLVLCAVTGKWRNWKECYPTILYVIIGDITCKLLLYKKPLWIIADIYFKYSFLYIFLIVGLYSGTSILFLSYYPYMKSKKKQLLYYLFWNCLYTGIEIIAYHIGEFKYFCGWNIFYTIIFNIIMFPLIRLHRYKPLLVWPISTALAFIVIWMFKIPLAR